MAIVPKHALFEFLVEYLLWAPDVWHLLWASHPVALERWSLLVLSEETCAFSLLALGTSKPRAEWATGTQSFLEGLAEVGPCHQDGIWTMGHGFVPWVLMQVPHCAVSCMESGEAPATAHRCVGQSSGESQGEQSRSVPCAG